MVWYGGPFSVQVAEKGPFFLYRYVAARLPFMQESMVHRIDDRGELKCHDRLGGFWFV